MSVKLEYVCNSYTVRIEIKLTFMETDLINSLVGTPPLVLKRRVNIAENQPKLLAALERIEKACGVMFDFEVDWVSILPLMNENWADNCGIIIYDSYLASLAANIEQMCKDDLTKEAFVEKVQSKKLIRFVLDTTEKPNSYVDCPI